ncbi:MAG: BamA/TamA family outer membrane protein [Bacteroides sp.]|nr:BamA/TamA family outer membrane protein [Bacteroides sp.]MCM1378557.1 BamA/TamA family outer membrane protein [Bacteroides sp.]MCM1444858.1 BamA/TamA family outer membrane protein [Prevotella sp.]
MKRFRGGVGLAGLALLLLCACSSTKHVPPGERLLSRTRIEMPADGDLKASDLNNYLRQKPNARTLGLAPMRLHTYSLSGADSTKWYNRWLRRLGEPPVIYSQRLTDASARQLNLALLNRGYMNPRVTVDTVHRGDKKIEVTYNVAPGLAHKIASVTREVQDSALARHIADEWEESLLQPGENLDLTLLDSERTRITNALQRCGYYGFAKDKISYLADTVSGSRNVALTLKVSGLHHRYTIRNVLFQPGYDPTPADSLSFDTTAYKNIYLITPRGEKSFIAPSVLEQNNWIQPGQPYNAEEFNRTYESLGRLGIVRSITVALDSAGLYQMDAVVRLTRNSLQGITAELEGTNSEGDLGAGVGLTYQHRNLFRGSETLSVKARGSYESLSGNLEGLINNHYTEAAAEVALTLPKFSAPFLSRNYKRKMLASTEFSINGNYQERPEYTRVIAGAGWRYKWNNRRNNNRRVFDLLDISYVFLPRSTINFLDEVAGSNPLLRYSYEDHFIMRMGYSAFLTNKRVETPLPGVKAPAAQRLIWTFRGSAEIAGNLLYAISNIVGQHKSDGAYKIFGTQYAQYAKAEADYMINRRFTRRTSLAFRVGAGVAVPYGNSSMVPFEKRYYAGGANSVRGWGVRTLGPGRYDARNTVSNFINQCGDIRLDINLEARCKLFWVVEGALFVDGGNVWTIRNYETQPGGQFSFRTFAQEIAWGYGAGIRLDFTYFLIRLDLGIKAYNPAMNQERWPLIHPNWGRDAAFHFSVGYPF